MSEPGRDIYFEVVARWADDLAHEIKNPIHAMVINLELVKQRAGGKAEGIIERAEIVGSELNRVHTLLDSFLHLVRPWSAQAPARVHTVFDALLPAFQARCGVRKLDYRHVHGEATAAIPPGALARALVILGDRAIDVTPARGHLVTAVALKGNMAEIVFEHHPAAADEHVAVAPDREPRVQAARAMIESAGGSLDLGTHDEGGRITLRLRSGSEPPG